MDDEKIDLCLRYQRERDDWRKRAEKAERERDALAELLERARDAYAGTGQLSRLVRLGKVLNEVPNPQSLTRLKSQWQAEAYRKALLIFETNSRSDALDDIDDLRREAEEE